MNFAVMGNAAHVLPLLAAIDRHAEHSLVYAIADESVQPKLLAKFPAIRLLPHWNELPVDSQVEAIIVGGAETDHLDGAKQLAAMGKHLLVLPEVQQDLTFIYELTLIAQDGPTLTHAVLPRRVHPTIEELQRLIESGQIGRLLHVRFDRQSTLASAGLLDATAVHESLLLDADLLRAIGGDYNRVTAIYATVGEDKISQATVTLAGDGLAESTWMLTPDSESNRWQIVIRTEQGQVTLSGGEGDLIKVESDIDAATNLECGSDYDATLAVIDDWTSRLNADEPTTNWTDLTRAFEIVDAAGRSIKRRRTIDLHFETTSERNMFKSQMTAMGCGLLSVTLFAFVFVLIIAQFVDPRSRLQAEAEAADAIIYADDFEQATATLTDAGRERIDRIADRFEHLNAEVVVEWASSDVSHKLDEARREAVISELVKREVLDPDQHVIGRELAGTWYTPFFYIARIAVFLPLFLFLVLQSLLFVARPG